MIVDYVGDGPRDHAMVPELVRGVIGEHVVGRTDAWKDVRLHGRGYARKLRYALTRAGVDGADAVVATVDRDRAPPRLPDLDRARQGTAVRCAVGEAVPHGEAWLIDDLEALRQVVALPATAKAPALRDPKAELDALIDAAGLSDQRLDVFTRLASALSLARCRRAGATGLEAFLADVESHLG